MWTDRGRGEAASQGDRPDAAALRHARPGRRPDRAVRRARRDADVPAGPRSVRPRPPRRDRLGGGPTATVRRMRVAVLSDIHGVLPALEAVLAEPEVAAADRIVLTGDIAAGPQPVEVLDRLAAEGERVVWVGGNADRELVEYRRGRRDTIPDPIAPFAADRLREDQVDFLAGLPLSVTLGVRG